MLERVGRVLLGDTSHGKPGKIFIAEDAFEIAGDVATSLIAARGNDPLLLTLARELAS